MKILNIKNIAILFVTLFVFSSCKQELDELYVGSSTAHFTVSNKDKLFAPANVYFTNASKFGEAYEWSFPNGDLVIDGELTGTITYADLEPEKVFYNLPGDYTVTLKVTADGATKEHVETITVQKPMPKLFADPVGIVYAVENRYYAEVFKYPGEEDKVTYSWDFGDGTPAVTTEEAMHTFAIFGDYEVTLTYFDGYETLVTTQTFTVKKAIVRSLFITDALTGKLQKKMLYKDSDAEPHIQLPVNCGLHPLSVSVYKDRVIISDAGGHIKWSVGGTDADGRVFTTNLVGEDEYTITSGSDLNGSGDEYVNDPFASCVDENGNVYWLDRFQGIRKMNYVEKNGAYPTEFFAQILAADLEISSTYGWTDGGLRIIDGDFWYSKHGSGNGIYKYSLEDGSYIETITGFDGRKVRAFDVDLVNNKVYYIVSENGANEGFWVSNLDGSGEVQLDNFLEGDLDGSGVVQYSREGGPNERTSGTSVVVDNVSGYVYFPFRHKDDVDVTGVVIGDGSKSGIKRYKLDQTVPTDVEWYINGVIPYGVGIDYELR